MYSKTSTETLKELLAEAKARLLRAKTGREAMKCTIAIRKIERELAAR